MYLAPDPSGALHRHVFSRTIGGMNPFGTGRDGGSRAGTPISGDLADVAALGSAQAEQLAGEAAAVGGGGGSGDMGMCHSLLCGQWLRPGCYASQCLLVSPGLDDI